MVQIALAKLPYTTWEVPGAIPMVCSLTKDQQPIHVRQESSINSQQLNRDKTRIKKNRDKTRIKKNLQLGNTKSFQQFKFDLNDDYPSE